MIYFDNAATTKYKPEQVYEAFNYYVREVGVSPGRGSYSLAIQASRMLFQARKTVANFFGVNAPSNVAFTKNSTEAINLFLRGYLKQGDHVLISPYEHNAVLRPLHTLMEEGRIEYTVLPEEVIYNPAELLSTYVQSSTKLLVCTLSSNLTGQIVFSKELSAEAHRLGLFVFLDSSQGAGKIRINMSADGIDALAFTGHKDLMALPGVGGLVSLDQLIITPLVQGGTGIHGESYTNPQAYPDSYESGTLNMPAIWALKSAVEYVEDHFEDISKKESHLMAALTSRLSALSNVTVYHTDSARVSTLCFNVKNTPSSTVVKILDEASICVRGGIHCAILAHQTLGTVESGAIRVSLNHLNTEEEIDQFIEAIKGIS